jgi:hypothetical protein
MNMSNKQNWLTVTTDNATIKLSRPSLLNGVRQDKLTLRTPTVGDLRGASKHSKDDAEAQDVFLFASLAECSPDDIEKLTVRDFRRVQKGYFRLVAEDDESGIENSGEAAGA